MSFSQKLCPAPFPPVSCSFPELSGPTMLPLQSSGGTSRKYLTLGREMLGNIQSLYTFKPSSSMFPTTSATTASLSEPNRAGDRHTMPARSSSVGGIPSRAVGLPGIMSANLGVSPAGRLGPSSYYPSPKVTNISPGSNLHSTSMEHLDCCLLSICS